MPSPLVQSTGRRKQAVARVRLRPGTGAITVNGRSIEEYFPTPTHRMVLTEPLKITETADVYDVDATLNGSGAACGTLQVPRSGFTVDITYSDASSTLDQASIALTADVTVRTAVGN